jgi:hypothetical protein
MAYIMKPVYVITAIDFGKFFLKRRRVAKALRWWLRENGYTYSSTLFLK